MGYNWAGACYETLETQLSAIQRDYPYQGGYYITALTSSSNTASTVTIATAVTNLTTNTGAFARTTSYTQRTCTYDEFSASHAVDGVSIQFIAVMIGCALMFGFGAAFGKS